MHKNKLYAGWAEAGGEFPIQGLSERERRAHIALLDLSGFTGTQKLYQVALYNRTVCTDGAKFVADTAGAWWLLDIMVTYQFNPVTHGEKFQVWKLTVWEDRTATLECQDGNGNLIISHEIESTDFPVPEMTLWFVKDGLPTILLPSEY